MTITSEQCLAARILARVDRPLLSSASGVPVAAIARFEKTRVPLPPEDLGRLQRALARLGADFIPEDAAGGLGVRLRFDADLSRRISAWESEGGLPAEDDVY
ncbi:XRE family transcriptional regulator [Chelativorans sp. AA-79]|uniref:XRE family transcriptional regulator n=1 Tax=Chelativorans sp. AA-79 TaxID=3028735 RepID=UPI0023F6242B|nr:XRE family transcriptional regulator [Chelativorans sp. AA-79]WEX10721.1 XRE family transcriptional regulator [Chelativorans sp. AA-79]